MGEQRIKTTDAATDRKCVALESGRRLDEHPGGPRPEPVDIEFSRKRKCMMPVVKVSFYEGRSREQKREIAEVITEALVRVAGSKREAVNVLFDCYTREDWVIGGAPEYARSRTNPEEPGEAGEGG